MILCAVLLIAVGVLALRGSGVRTHLFGKVIGESKLAEVIGGVKETKGSVDPSTVEIPDWITVDLIRVNEYSRPGDKLEAVNGVVVHYTGNPGTTAEQNRSYFDNLADTGETSASSNFIIGIDGTIIMCVPIDEVAYASSQRNYDTISIECCHADSTGEFSEETYASLVKLVKWLMEEFHLEQEDIMRHYDVTGKECPLYYVKNPEAWEQFLADVAA